jgi:hypothetical protein
MRGLPRHVRAFLLIEFSVTEVQVMSIWLILLVVAIAGALGGVINALMTDNGFLMPRTEVADNVQIIRPGVFGNIVISAVGACISWGLYGPFNIAVVVGTQPAAIEPNLTLSALAGAMLVGIAGAKWLTNEVDKKLLQATASVAASSPSSSGASRQILLSTPAGALNVARELRANT